MFYIATVVTVVASFATTVQLQNAKSNLFRPDYKNEQQNLTFRYCFQEILRKYFCK